MRRRDARLPRYRLTGPSKCLNGSIDYLPALLGLIVIGALMRQRGHPAAHYLLWAALVFAISVTLRSLDVQLCNSFTIAGRKVGTHAAWHLLNAGVLFLLLRSSSRGRAPDEGTVAWTICPVQCGSAPMVGIHRRGC